MFYTKTNASKVALAYLGKHLKSIGIEFIDCQLTNPFLESMGCKEISRDAFIELKNQQLQISPHPSFWHTKQLVW